MSLENKLLTGLGRWGEILSLWTRVGTNSRFGEPRRSEVSSCCVPINRKYTFTITSSNAVHDSLAVIGLSSMMPISISL